MRAEQHGSLHQQLWGKSVRSHRGLPFFFKLGLALKGLGTTAPV